MADEMVQTVDEDSCDCGRTLSRAICWSDVVADIRADADRRAAEIVDEVVVERLVRGERVTATERERVAAARVLLGRGLGAGAISNRLRVSGPTARRLVFEAGGRA